MTSAPGRIAGAAVVDDRGVGAVMTIRRQAAPAGAEIVVGIAVVDGFSRIEVPVRDLSKRCFHAIVYMFAVSSYVGRIEVVLPARVARSGTGMRPADAEIVLRREVLGQGEPQAVSLPLVLKFQIGRQVPLQVLVDAADCQTESELVLRADLERRFVRDIREIRRRKAVVGRDSRILGLQENCRSRNRAAASWSPPKYP